MVYNGEFSLECCSLQRCFHWEMELDGKSWIPEREFLQECGVIEKGNGLK